MPGPINTAGAEDSPYPTHDGRAFLFFFTPDAAVPAEKQLLDGVTGIWSAEALGASWSEPTRVWLAAPDEPALDGCPFVLGETLYFCSGRVGNLREIDLYVAGLREDGPGKAGKTPAGKIEPGPRSGGNAYECEWHRNHLRLAPRGRLWRNGPVASAEDCRRLE